MRICSICARGGSKGVKNKNIRPLLGKPLIAHSILQAKASGLFEYVAVSSDSVDILNVAKEWGADYCIKRADDLASDHAAKHPAIQHCFKEVERLTALTFDTLVDLDVTSPLRSYEDIVNAVNLLEEHQINNVITGSPARRSPYFNLVELNDSGFVVLSKKLEKSIVRRQDSPKCYDANASIYVWTRSGILNSNTVLNDDTMLSVMPESRSIDIDSELDFEFVQFLMQKQKGLS